MVELLWVRLCDASKIVTCWLYISCHIPSFFSTIICLCIIWLPIIKEYFATFLLLQHPRILLFRHFAIHALLSKVFTAVNLKNMLKAVYICYYALFLIKFLLSHTDIIVYIQDSTDEVLWAISKVGVPEQVVRISRMDHVDVLR